MKAKIKTANIQETISIHAVYDVPCPIHQDDTTTFRHLLRSNSAA